MLAPMPCLVFKDKQGRRIEVPLTRPEMTVGRDAVNDISIPFRSMSRAHCAFVKKEDGVYVRDLGSSNGTLVNDRPADGEVKLADKDQVKVGELRIRFYAASKYPNAAMEVGESSSIQIFGKELARQVAKKRPGSFRPGMLLAMLAAFLLGGVLVGAILLVLLQTGTIKLR